MTTPSVSFTDVQRVLGLFADGVSGQALPIEVVDDEGGVWPWRASVVDEPGVSVPAVAVDRGALRAVVLPHTGFSEFGSFDSQEEREASFAAAARPGLVRRVFGVLEDRRIDEATHVHYPGARRDLDQVLATARGAAPAEAPVKWRAALVESLQLHSLGASPDELAAPVLPDCVPCSPRCSRWRARGDGGRQRPRRPCHR